MPSLAAVLVSNAKFSRPDRPVAVVVGGTSGVGQGIVEALAKHTQGNAHIVIVGRSQSSADKIIADLPKHPQSLYEFVACDVSLMANTRATADALASRLEKINYLVLSPGITALKRIDTTEGVDLKLAVHYYSRAAFMLRLTPLLEKAAAAGEDARVMTVLDSKRGGPLDLQDLGLDKNYSLQRAATHAITFNDTIVAELAARHPTVSFTHIYPGLVKTNLGRDLNWALRAGAAAFMSVAGVSHTTCGEYMFYSLTNPNHAHGAFSANDKGDDIQPNKNVTPEGRKAVWEHTLKVTGVRATS